ncbi:hypothetical protein CALCODRAFT_468388 [Calocera cornea HHB12733]|uniref:Bromodomain-containing protein n=1 Tax=Calocera cornea HHB12733 TaxID=1353952 RepID=A0A165GSQ4_9BASI|nr:hypothetical protein CALCODRAFT_468388 [Calocera cornea HHB12733]
MPISLGGVIMDDSPTRYLALEGNGEPSTERQRLAPRATKASLRAYTYPLATTDVAQSHNYPNGLKPARVSTFSVAQYRLATTSLRQLKKNRDASPFVKPVDTVGLNIPHYNTVIKHPMDLGTVEEKLRMSNPLARSGTLQYSRMLEISELAPDKRYWSAEEFVAEVRLVFDNALKFYGKADVLGQKARRLLAIFDKQMGNLPEADVPNPVIPVTQSMEVGDVDDVAKDATEATKGNVETQVSEQVLYDEEDDECDDINAETGHFAAQKTKLAAEYLQRLQRQEVRSLVAKMEASRTAHEENDLTVTKYRESKPASRAARTPTTGPSSRRRNMESRGMESDQEAPVDWFKKRELAEEIPKLEGEALTDALAVIQGGLPQDSSMSEGRYIGVDIELLTPSVIRQLYDMVVIPAKKEREAEEKRRMYPWEATVGGRGVDGNVGKFTSARNDYLNGVHGEKHTVQAVQTEKMRMLEARPSTINGGGSAISMPHQQNMMDVDESQSRDQERPRDEASSAGSVRPSGAEKKFRCTECNRTFSTSGHRGRHMRIHTGERGYMCPFPACHHTCSRRDNLHQHYRTHLPKSKYYYPASEVKQALEAMYRQQGIERTVARLPPWRPFP